MDDMTLITTTVPCVKSTGKTKNFKWVSMKITQSKSRSLSISRGKLIDRKFAIDQEEIQITQKKTGKSLGRWYNADLHDREQVKQFRNDVAEGLDNTDNKLGFQES